ncbi:MAG: hypothetical protein P9L88_08885 [Candidatus Tantalella remota]|nr:hypothetical protein [Candidatus Tantalella remota]
MKNLSTKISVDSDNRLLLTEATLKPRKKLRKFLLEGEWSLSDDHHLKIKLRGAKSPYAGKTLRFTGDIQKVDGSSLVFRARGSDTLSGMRTSAIELKGVWQADRNNRLVFNVSRSRGMYDVLRFQGAWKVNKRNELSYRYRRTRLKRGVRKLQTLVFKGYWEAGKDRIVYRVEGNNNSFFAFRAAVQTKSLMASRGKIKYQVGIKYSRGRVYKEIVRTVTIFGKWKLNKDLSVRLEVSRVGGKKYSVNFGVEKVVWDNGRLDISLKASDGKALGVKVSFNKPFGSDAEFFFTASRLPKESRLEGGVSIRF